MRLIDADSLQRRICGAKCGCEYEDCGNEEGCVYDHFISNTPTIDAVPVVRCRECKHHRDKNEQEHQYLAEDILICTSQDATEDCWNAVWSDHFCSYGVRKEGADNETG